MSAALPLDDVRAALADLDAAWRARFGDLQKDAVGLADLATLLADVGVPDAALASDVFKALAILIPFARAARAGAAAPRPGPPLTQADWSHGFPPGPQPDPNPSGAVGPGWAPPDP